IAILVFAVQAYANYQKEQEKARKRNPGQPPIPPLPEENAERTLVNPEAELQRRPAAHPRPQAQPVREAYERYSGFVNTAETVRTKKIRKPSSSPSRIAVDAQEEPASSTGGASFDLRDAVIKSAILERPYP